MPKRLREQCGLSPGTELVIEAVADGVMIRPAHVRQALVERDGVLIHHGSGQAPVDIVALLRGEREARAPEAGVADKRSHGWRSAGGSE